MDVKNPGGETGENKRSTNSIELCIEICSTNRFTFAGMQVSPLSHNEGDLLTPVSAKSGLTSTHIEL